MSRPWLAWGLVATAALGGCGPAGKPPAVLGRAVLKEWPQVPWGEAIDPESVLVSVDADGKTHLDGRAVTPEVLRERLKKPSTVDAAFPGVDTDPVLLETHPALSFRNLQVILDALISRAARINLAFLVSTPDGPRGLVMPVTVDSSGLAFFESRTRYPEPEHRRERSLWIDVRPGAGGSARVAALRVGYYGEEKPRPVGEKLPANPPSEENRDDWGGDHPPLGIWTPESIRKLVEDPRLARQGAFVQLKVEGQDKMPDVLACLSAVRKEVGPKVILDMPVPDPIPRKEVRKDGQDCRPGANE
jgi:biopolymer transport protein ExbD